MHEGEVAATSGRLNIRSGTGVDCAVDTLSSSFFALFSVFLSSAASDFLFATTLSNNSVVEMGNVCRSFSANGLGTALDVVSFPSWEHT